MEAEKWEMKTVNWAESIAISPKRKSQWAQEGAVQQQLVVLYSPCPISQEPTPRNFVPLSPGASGAISSVLLISQESVTCNFVCCRVSGTPDKASPPQFPSSGDMATDSLRTGDVKQATLNKRVTVHVNVTSNASLTLTIKLNNTHIFLWQNENERSIPQQVMKTQEN